MMAGDLGFEPRHDGVKVRCLTTWLIPNYIQYMVEAEGSNRRPSACKADALPAELSLHM